MCKGFSECKGVCLGWCLGWLVYFCGYVRDDIPYRLEHRRRCTIWAESEKGDERGGGRLRGEFLWVTQEVQHRPQRRLCRLRRPQTKSSKQTSSSPPPLPGKQLVSISEGRGPLHCVALVSCLHKHERGHYASGIVPLFQPGDFGVAAQFRAHTLLFTSPFTG